jgi:hypothetical protein
VPDVKHAFTSGIADGGDATLVRPSNWNAAHGWPDARDVGTLVLDTDGEYALQLVRLTLSSTNRLTLAGALTRVVVFGATDDRVPNIIGTPYRPTTSFRIPDGHGYSWPGRLILQGFSVRGILEGDASMRLFDDNTSSRFVLTGTG